MYGHLVIPCLRTSALSRLTGHPWLNVEFIPYLWPDDSLSWRVSSSWLSLHSVMRA